MRYIRTLSNTGNAQWMLVSSGGDGIAENVETTEEDKGGKGPSDSAATGQDQLLAF